MRAIFAVTCLLTGAALAQFPGQRPGQSPFPGPTIPLPRRTPTTQREPGPATRTTRTVALEMRDTSGILRRLGREEFIIESGDHRIIWFRIGDELDKNGDLDPDKLHLGDHVTVTSTEDEQGYYTAVSVQWESAATVEDLAIVEQDWNMPSDSVVQELPGKDERPKLTRGKASEPEPPAPASTHERVRIGPPLSRPDDAALARAREAAANFLDTLPSFGAKQNTTRYVLENARAQWRALDVVTADLIYKDGAEVYGNIKIDNKTTSKPLDEIAGLRSTGEFGSILADLFHPGSGTEFAPPSQVELSGRRSWKYRFEVSRERSEFRIATPSQHYYTAYRGTIWVDFETSRVLRLEMQAAGLPREFPFDTVEMNIDYDFIRLDGAQQFLLPTQSEALNCIRDTSVCMRNSTSFRNYVKFNAESDIIFDLPK